MAEIMDMHPQEPPSLYTNEPLVHQMGCKGSRSSMLNAQGLRLATYWWYAHLFWLSSLMRSCVFV